MPIYYGESREEALDRSIVKHWTGFFFPMAGQDESVDLHTVSRMRLPWKTARPSGMSISQKTKELSMTA